MSLSTFVDLEITIDKKAQKDGEKKWRQDFMPSNLVEVVNAMKKENQKSHDERNEEWQEIIHFTKEKLEMELSKEKRKIMNMDTNSMPPMQREYFHSCQIEIIEKFRTK
jgi:hypothetical protein